MSASGEHGGRAVVKEHASGPAWVVNTAPRRGLPALRVDELWTHRELIYFFAVRDIKVRYKQALLGVGWALIQPLIGAVTFSILFHRLADVDVDAPSYFAFALLGSGVWSYYSATLQSGTASLLVNAELLTKVAFPRIVAPVATFVPGGIDLSVATLLSFVVAVGSGFVPSVQGIVLGLPAGLALLVLAVAGPVLLLSASVVKYRDVTALVGFAVPLLLFVSPVAYPPELVPEAWRLLLYVNPLAGALGLLRWALVGTAIPSAAELSVSLVVALLLLLAGLLHFRRTEREFADVI
jgi:ABC-2 type transport system permease protein/lipopolysaccharide transport system permease protein